MLHEIGLSGDEQALLDMAGNRGVVVLIGGGSAIMPYLAVHAFVSFLPPHEEL